jgi:phosphopantetheinyl transferase
MTEALIEDLKYFIDQVPGLEFHLDPKWASTYVDHRLNIRRHLYKKTKLKSVLDLDQIPKALELKTDLQTVKFVSISHSPVLGGFVLSSKQIGFDLEQNQRLSPSVLKRISDDDERQMLPAHMQSALWTIKESVYKCPKEISSNMVAVKIKSAEVVKNKYLKTLSQFNQEDYITLTLINVGEDICLSLSLMT